MFRQYEVPTEVGYSVYQTAAELAAVTPQLTSPTTTQASGFFPALTGLISSAIPAVSKFFEYKTAVEVAEAKAKYPQYYVPAGVTPIAKVEAIAGISGTTLMLLGGGALALILLTKKKGLAKKRRRR